MTEAEELHQNLLTETRKLLTGSFPTVIDFMDKALDKDIKLTIPPANQLPVCKLIPDSLDFASPLTSDIVSAIIQTIPFLQWQQSYTIKDGFDAHYLDNYVWFNLVSPDGPFYSEDIRISVGYWGCGLHYKNHWHEPEEIYIPLAGDARFHSEGTVSKIAKPGDLILHRSNQPHSIDMDTKPLLAMAVWRGANLNRKSGLPKT